MLDLLHIRELLDGPVIAAPEPVHDPVLLAAGLDADDNLVALLPLVHVLGNQLHGVLEIRHHLDDAVPGDLEHPVVGGVELAEIPGVENGLDPWILPAQPPDNIPGPVRGVIVNKHQLIVILRKLFLQYARDCLADGAYIFLLIVTGN